MLPIGNRPERRGTATRSPRPQSAQARGGSWVSCCKNSATSLSPRSLPRLLSDLPVELVRWPEQPRGDWASKTIFWAYIDAKRQAAGDCHVMFWHHGCQVAHSVDYQHGEQHPHDDQRWRQTALGFHVHRPTTRKRSFWRCIKGKLGIVPTVQFAIRPVSEIDGLFPQLSPLHKPQVRTGHIANSTESSVLSRTIGPLDHRYRRRSACRQSAGCRT